MPFPPTYDWDETAPAFESPTSPLMQPLLMRQMSSFHFNIPVTVGVADLDSLLRPLGFRAAPIPGTQESAVNLAFGVHTRLLAKGVTCGPYLNFVVIAPNSINAAALSRIENVILGHYISDKNALAVFHDINGPGTSLAPGDYSVNISEGGGSLDIKIGVDLTTYQLTASVSVPLAAMVSRFMAQPQPGSVPPAVPLRSTAGATPQRARWTAVLGDGTPLLAPAAANATLVTIPAMTLDLPVGPLDWIKVNDYVDRNNNQPRGPVAVRNNVEIISAHAYLA